MSTPITLHLERLELAAKTLEAFAGDSRNNRARDVREAATKLAALAAACRAALGMFEHRPDMLRLVGFAEAAVLARLAECL